MAQKKLHPGAKWLFRVRAIWSLIFLAIFIGIFWVATISESEGNFPFSNVFAILSITTIVALTLIIAIIEAYARLSYRFWAYEFTDTQLRIERGIIWKKYSNIPYERVQNIDITRGIIARLCNFSTVNIQTAGFSVPVGNQPGAHAEGHIPAVPVKEAEEIRNFVIKKITKKGRRQGL